MNCTDCSYFNGFLVRQVISNKRPIDSNEFKDCPAGKKRKTNSQTLVLSDVSEPSPAELPSAVKTHQTVTLCDSDKDRLAKSIITNSLVTYEVCSALACTDDCICSCIFARSITPNKRSTNGGEIEDDQGSKKPRTSSRTGVLPLVSELNSDKSANKATVASGTLCALLSNILYNLQCNNLDSSIE